MTQAITIDYVRSILEPLGLSVLKVSGGDYRVAPMTGTEREREAFAYYVDTLEMALNIGKQFVDLRGISDKSPVMVVTDAAEPDVAVMLPQAAGGDGERFRAFVGLVASLGLFSESGYAKRPEKDGRPFEWLTSQDDALEELIIDARGLLKNAPVAPDVDPTPAEAAEPEEAHKTRVDALLGVLGALSGPEAIALLRDVLVAL